MRAIEQRVSNLIDETIYARLAQGAFLIYLFFIFFGTSKPFPDLTPGANLAEKSNPVNQLLSLLFLISLLSLVGKLEQVRVFIVKEKFLTLFLIWGLFSVVWSNYSVVSLKRWISLFGEVIIILAALLHFRWSEVALRGFRVIVSLYLPLTILAVLFVPAAIQWEFPAWRGLADTKNNLGQVTLFSIVLLLTIIPYNKKRPINALHYVLLACAVIAYLGARSTTAFLIGGVLLLIYGVLHIGKILMKENMASVFALFVILGGVVLGGLIVVLAPEVLAHFFGFFGKDLTFSGRVDLWATVLGMTEGKVLTGWGVGGFWVSDAAHMTPIYEQFVWIPNQAHQGYIDVFSQLGFIGFVLLLLMIVGYFKRLVSLRKGQIWKWLFISVLILNMQESVFFRPRHIGHFMFVFAYAALHTDLLKERWVIHMEQRMQAEKEAANLQASQSKEKGGGHKASKRKGQR